MIERKSEINRIKVDMNEMKSEIKSEMNEMKSDMK